MSDLVKYWGVNPKRILHVGAHNAEELTEYTRHNWNEVTWVEAQPDKYENLKSKLPPHHKLINAAVWNEGGVKLELKVMTNTQSTSLLDLGTHATEHPNVTLNYSIPVVTKTLNELISADETPDLIVLDIQGAELKALQGFGDRIKEVDWIYCEVNRDYLYNGCCLVSDLDEYLAPFGFKRVETRWTHHGWGDALFTKDGLNPSLGLLKQACLRISALKWLATDFRMRIKKLLIRIQDRSK